MNGGPGTTNPNDPSGQLIGGQNAPGSAGQLGGLGNQLSNSEGDNTSGLPIAGVRTLCDEKPFRVYKGEDEYAKWLFTYLDLDQRAGGAAKGKGKGKGGLSIRPGAATGAGAGGRGGAGAAGQDPRR